MSWTQKRSTPGGTADLDDKNQIRFKAKGRSPTNEEDALEVCARLVRILNAEGADWSDPIEGIDDVDCRSTDRRDQEKSLQMQVVRASNNEAMWAELSREGVAEVELDSDRAAGELMAAVTKKSTKYPDAQRRVLTLVVDAGRTPGHTFQQVFDTFRRLHFDACRSCGFEQVWAVGAVDELVARLDA